MGRASIRDLQREISSHDFAEWQAFSLIEPIGEARADLRMGILASTIVNLQIDPRRHAPLTPGNFIPDFDQAPRPPQTWQQQLVLVSLLSEAGFGDPIYQEWPTA